MENQKLVELLRSDHDCDTCGFVNCKHDICLMDAMAADVIENLQTENAALRRHIDNLTSAQAVMVKEFTAKLEELEAMRNELCYKCGNYEQAHNGWCNHCRWKKGA